MYKYRHTEMYKGVRIDVRANSKQELNAKTNKRKDKIDAGEQRLNNMTVRDWCEEWLATYKQPSVSNSWYIELRNRTQALCEELGHMYLRNVTLTDLKRYVNRYEGKSDKYIRTNVTIVREIFHDAYYADLIPKDPADKLTVPQGRRTKERKPLTKYEADLFLQAAPKNDLYLPLLFMYYCALRPAEAVVLTWGDIDFDNRVVFVTKALKKDGSIGGTKTGIDRTVPIPSVLLDTLEGKKGKATEYIAGRHTRGSIHHRVRILRKDMQAIHAANGCPEPFDPKDFTLYRLRHTACTNWEQMGMPLNIAKALMGHKDIQMTARIYTHFTEDTLELAKKIMR